MTQNPKQERVQSILDLKYELAMANFAKAQTVVRSIEGELELLEVDRSGLTSAPDEVRLDIVGRYQIWLLNRRKSLMISLAAAMAEAGCAKEKLRIAFGQKQAFERLSGYSN